jgi:Domain of unknown function (DUF1707)/Domain of unknown function (DUF4190)
VSHEPDLRASDADREAAVERLRAAALDGRLDGDELEERLAQAYGATWCSELARLTDDVTPPVVFVRQQPRVNPLAICSLIAAIVWFGWLGSVAAVVMGHTALSQIRRSNGAETGRAAALIGTALGYFGLTALLMIILFAIAI